jgi:cell division septation protein DedD
MEQTTATQAEPAHDAEASCPHCGEPAKKDQLVCLRCGGRLALDYRRPPGWKLPTAIVAAVALAAAGAFGWALRAVTHNAKTEVANAPAGKSTSGGAPKTPATQPKPKPPAAAKKQAKAPAAQAPKAPSVPATAFNPPGTWPAAKNGFTVVLTSTDNPGSAKETARSVKQSGVPSGYLRSNDYPSLQKGFWLVYGGVYDTRGQAEKAAAKVGKGYPGAYVQWVDGATAARRAAKRKKG